MNLREAVWSHDEVYKQSCRPYLSPGESSDEHISRCRLSTDVPGFKSERWLPELSDMVEGECVAVEYEDVHHARYVSYLRLEPEYTDGRSYVRAGQLSIMPLGGVVYKS